MSTRTENESRTLARGGTRDRTRLAAIGRSSDDFSVATIARLRPPSSGNILDVGCGTGDLARRLAREVVPRGSVTALDRDVSAIGPDTCEIDVVAADLTAWRPPEDVSYDVVHARYVLAHVADAAEALARVCSWVRADGHIVITEPLALPLDPATPRAVRRVFDGYHSWAERGGMSLTFAAAAPGLIGAVGGTDIVVETRVSRFGGGPGVDRWAALIGPFAGQLRASGVHDADLDEFFSAAADPGMYVAPQLIVTTSARLP
ncbi:Methyltransferase type 12 OS=Tsukamurella paurometabola (strain ATCC 8368 / DSM / CCUG 35730/ CIP 100753 / JCM 10117 / KCTC 9821 / NBRC 16120 / NCIMB 702349/ NCTC 13040) OX=521096 GN=Tpau_2754 PE=4 SV=1 [Tsukamurella paurometabola]|uniref:Methyltransferase type 12 n=1 Tax=Tsukamurella paurometabola (strain ATCC 8368 / DSM 20162 / CCUG 35730 / CIP 100753 / JCM 10117 / KCTC 9821 / NBRC 16120 / NCIMB 702349 / NCTC 13040) TaxID=521096 RepID=D5UST1_TSUPD|nr:class I SAM-dependent methyltransferase [Tsukamurella paurometabola]ADG79352.1 Methyltransferase type 12 [Tsukamurella paurometabola DSM 20162]SUP35209.1 Trans-aconitate methyltransferase [Tsukamurella paurometabola]